MLGAFNVLKPTGWTSSDVVVKIKHMLRDFSGDKKIKVGHLGTLDPAGSGVLPIVFGKATRLFDYYVNGEKLYRSTFVFGKTTDTLDSFGQIVKTSEVIPSLTQLQEIIKEFVGEILQIPPQYSRISVGGVRACDVARQGEQVEIQPRKITIYDINILRYENGILTLDVRCSGGTYIRSLCRDIAGKLNTVAYMSSIIRLENKGFLIENAVTMDELQKNIEKHIISLDELLKNEIFVDLNEIDGKKLLNGIKIDNRNISGDYVVKINGDVFGICRDGKEFLEVMIRLWK